MNARKTTVRQLEWLWQMRQGVALVSTGALLAVGTLVGVQAAEGSSTGGVPASANVVTAEMKPGQWLKLTPGERVKLNRMTDTPAKQKSFERNLRKGLGAYGMTMKSAPGSDATIRSTATSASASTTGGVEDAFAQGWSGDHWWMTASYADFAYGGTAAATAACLVYLPWFICAPVAAIAASWVRGWGAANNHGIWMAIYRTGYITGGRW